MHIITARVPGAARLARVPELSRMARQRVKWMDYYRGHGRNATANDGSRPPRDLCSAFPKCLSRCEAVGRFRQWAARWREMAPKAVACLREGLEELLPFLDCSQTHWKKVCTTNAIERAFREVRRRTRPMNCFQDSDSVDRTIFGVISHLNKAGQAPQRIHTLFLTLPTQYNPLTSVTDSRSMYEPGGV